MFKFLQFTVAVVLMIGCGHLPQQEVFIDGWWDKDYAKNVCDAVKVNGQTACRQAPEAIAAELRVKFVSSFQQTAECKGVNIFGGFVDPMKSTGQTSKRIAGANGAFHSM